MSRKRVPTKSVCGTSVLRSEIAEQPDVLERLLRDGMRRGGGDRAAIRARDIHHVVIAARGSSDNAARYAQYLFGAHSTG